MWKTKYNNILKSKRNYRNDVSLNGAYQWRDNNFFLKNRDSKVENYNN